MLLRIAVAAIGVWFVLRSSWDPSRLGERDRWWAVAAVVIVTVALVWLMPALRRLLPRPGDAPLVLAGVLLAMYLCVPETDHIVEVAAVLGIVTIGEALTRRRLPDSAMLVLAIYVLWAGVFGATGRQSALVTAFVAWWPVLLLPLLARWRPALANCGEWARGSIVFIGTLATWGVARTGGVRTTVMPAVVASIAAITISLLIAAGVATAATRRFRAATP